jgi:transposase
MLQQKKHVNTITSVIRHWIDGQMQVKLNLLQMFPIIDDLLLNLSNKMFLKKITSMQESVVANNQMILRDKSNILPINSQTLKSFQMLEARSILTERDLSSSLKNFLREMSAKCMLPTPIVSQGSHSSSLSGSLNILEQNSLIYHPSNIMTQPMNRNLLETSLQSLLTIPQNIMVRDDTPLNQNNQPLNKRNQCLKIRFYPDNVQKIYFGKCFGIYRLVYNNSVDYINKNKSTNFINVRNNVLALIKEKYNNDNDWFNELYFDSKSLAVKEACNSFISNYKKGNQFHIRFKSKRSPSQNLKIDFRTIKFENNELYIFKRKLNDKLFIRNKDCKKINNIITNHIICDSEITRDKSGAYYLCLNYETSNVNIDKKIKTVSIDPGIRTYYNCYTKNGIQMKLGNNINILYNNLLKQSDKIASDKSKSSGRKKKKLIKRHKTINNKIKNIVNNSQNQITSFLARTFDEVITGPLQVKSIVNRARRNIGERIVRDIMVKAPYRLHQKLIDQCNKYNTKLHIVDEHHTSLTCSECKNVKNKNDLKGSRIYDCNKCHLKMDRDYNAAKNIMLRHYGLFSPVL